MSGSLERLVDHDFRLKLLGCLVDRPLPLPKLRAKVGKPEAAVAYHLRLLEDREVVERMNGLEDDDAIYVATLDKQPPWVAEAVAGYKEGMRRPSVMVGMGCDGCERLLRYGSKIVAVYWIRGSGSLRAKLVTEDTPESGESANLRATAKYHHGCYGEARNRDPSLPVVE